MTDSLCAFLDRLARWWLVRRRPEPSGQVMVGVGPHGYVFGRDYPADGPTVADPESWNPSRFTDG